MIQFAYQPAFDPFHTVFRLLRLLTGASPGPLPYDTLRIMDFYLLFPFRLEDFRFKQGDQRFRALARKYSDTRGYSEQPTAVTVFERMDMVQEAAVQTLSEHGAIDGDLLVHRGEVQFQLEFNIVPQLSDRVAAENRAQEDLLAFLTKLSTYPLLGPGGLKARSGLMEFRYDAV